MIHGHIFAEKPLDTLHAIMVRTRSGRIIIFGVDKKVLLAALGQPSRPRGLFGVKVGYQYNKLYVFLGDLPTVIEFAHKEEMAFGMRVVGGNPDIARKPRQPQQLELGGRL